MGQIANDHEEAVGDFWTVIKKRGNFAVFATSLVLLLYEAATKRVGIKIQTLLWIATMGSNSVRVSALIQINCPLLSFTSRLTIFDGKMY